MGKGAIIFQLVSYDKDSIVSSVSGTVTADMNNTELLCRDGLRLPGKGEQQAVRFKVIGEVTSLVA